MYERQAADFSSHPECFNAPATQRGVPKGTLAGAQGAVQELLPGEPPAAVAAAAELGACSKTPMVLAILVEMLRDPPCWRPRTAQQWRGIQPPIP